MSQNLSIAVAGAGIGGLTVAALLAQDGHRVTVFDRFAQPQPVGSGLVIQPVGQTVLGLIGADVAASVLGRAIHRMTGVEAGKGRRVLDVRYDRPGGGRHGLAIHRAALFGAIHAAAIGAGVTLVQATQVAATELQGGGREVLEAGGRSLGRFDLVVDAAGAASPLSPLVARALPYGAVWGTVPWPRDTGLPADELSQRYLRASHMAGVLPLGRLAAGQPEVAAIFWSLPRAVLAQWHATDIAAWKAQVTDLWPEMTPFLAPVTRAADMTPALYSHGTLSRPWDERLVHIGDAAHRASPQLAQGANMALLDAMALALAVRRNGAEAGLAFARMRRWHLRLYQAASAGLTPLYQSDSWFLPGLRDRILAPVSRLWPMPALLSRLVCGTLSPPLAGVDFPRWTPHDAARQLAGDRE